MFGKFGVFYFTAFVALSTFDNSPVHASENELLTAVLSVGRFDGNYADKGKRVEYAEAIKSYWEHLNARIPNLSPKENEWLDRELSSPDSVRWYNARRSKEHSIRMLRDNISSCLSSVNNTLSSQIDEDSFHFEMFHWNKLITCHSNYDTFVNDLENAKLLEGDKIATENMLRLVSSYINVKFVPSAMADIMDWELISQ